MARRFLSILDLGLRTPCTAGAARSRAQEALRQREDKLAAADAELASLRERSERPAVLKFPYVRKDRVRRSGHACFEDRGGVTHDQGCCAVSAQALLGDFLDAFFVYDGWCVADLPQNGRERVAVARESHWARTNWRIGSAPDRRIGAPI